MSRADIIRLAEQAVFRPSHELADLAIDHVDFDSVAGGQLAERPLVAALTEHGDRGRVAVLGPSGAGKSSLIARILQELVDTHTAIVVEVGNAGVIEDPRAFARFVLEILRSEVQQSLSRDQRDVVDSGLEAIPFP